ncbi:MAG: hypothetical protein ACXVFV_12660 [Mycobacteriales bacterium]
MAEEDKPERGPSLELPSLGLRRKKRAARGEQAPEPAPVDDTPTTVFEADDAAPAPPAPAPAPTPAPVPPPAPVPSEPATPPLFADEAPRPAEPVTQPVTEPVTRPVTEPVAEPTPVAEDAPEPGARKESRSLPLLGGMAASIVTGLLVGLITVGLTWASLHLCEVLKGTSSCGGPGFLLLLAITVAMVFLGALLLRAWRVPDPGSTSFLAVGLLAVLALLFLVDVLFAWWMIVVIPLFSVLTFALSHWVTTAFIEPAEH